MKSPQKPTKTIICSTDDWFIISHFKPLLQSVKSVSDDVNVIARYKLHKAEIETYGVRTIPLNFKRRGFQLIRSFVTIWRLLKLFYKERPDIIHLIAMKPILLGGLAYCFSPAKSVVIHFTGVGLLGTSKSRKVQLLHRLVMFITARIVSQKKSWLLIENPDDQKQLEYYNAKLDDRLTLLGGAGINPESYPAHPFIHRSLPENPPVVTFIGRMVWSKGIDILVKAQERILSQGGSFNLQLCGAADPGNPTAIDLETLKEWNERPQCNWLGKISAEDVPEIWRTSDIAVVPSRGGEGLPRSLLEAAASARPLIVTDVPGCRHFVRDGIEGFIIPPDNIEALSEALRQVLTDVKLRERMGRAARERVLSGFTEDHVKEKIADTYREIIRRIA